MGCCMTREINLTYEGHEVLNNNLNNAISRL